MADEMLDAKGLSCPLPILRAKKLLKIMSNNDRLTVIATDPGSLRDFPSFCAQTGNSLEEAGEIDDGVYRFLIRKIV
ncbi:MAG TPA: sulfurtransferase TusA family protein [Candidatus Sulfotelmatobacter sp.]|jgi:tRNA 2-thiouridine synthesizing protein A|nr:sulfurtransferase TusA family protein [Candidatus Sulfotelmatobacter sp.]